MTTLSTLEPHRFLAVETYRRSGVAVVTPVWFVEHDGLLYFSAPSHTGKVKRLRHTARARIAPCDQRGTVTGDWTEVTITPASDAAAHHADALLKARYGWQRKLIDAFGWLRGWQHTMFVITPRVADAAPAPTSAAT